MALAKWEDLTSKWEDVAQVWENVHLVAPEPTLHKGKSIGGLGVNFRQSVGSEGVSLVSEK